MAKHVYVVMSNPTDGREDDYNEWYTNRHLDDVLKLPGFMSAQRFRLSSTTPPQSAPHRYLAVYEIETDDIDKANMTLRDAARSGELPLSDALDVRNLHAWFYEPITSVVASSGSSSGSR